MPPPPHRRTGFSRKAQYGLLFGYAVAVAGILVALLLLAIAVVDPRGFSAIKGAALDATAPVSAGGRSVTQFFSGIGEGVSAYFRAGSQNASLRRELEQTRRDLVAAQTARAENAQLRALLGLARQTEDEITVARIVGSSYGSARRLATLSAGAGDGVRVGQPVRSADGLIGRVLEAGRWASRVLLVSDGASSVPVRSLRNNVPALAVGRGDGTIELRTLEVGVNPFRGGDIVVTSGIGGIFPPGVPVARVVRLEGDTAIARPLADPARTEAAIVQPIYQPAAAGELEDAQPANPSGPVSGPPPGAPALETTPEPLQRNPNYQPALQDPQPGQFVRPPAVPAQPPARPEPQG
ncbi:rod shape-determining protein MreC [Sphingosinicella sp. CPCC 101087]|uniref:rod shape-determining protein MreC n=1 Tax=Sphingosinicella sp. CPCC 101087 TaxID=2497754 RepID=UPI00101DEF4E|nr:rod shape-determining protein MreC [Sphingosinicella sp. CPCC 101087]